MKISKVIIENYRSIRQLVIHPSSFNVLIGENNAGKSNILRAIGLVLGDIWPSERMFSEDDFYNRDTSMPILIQVFFSDIITRNRNRMRLEIAGFQLSCKAYKRRVGDKPAGTLKVDYVCISKTGKPLKYPAEPFEKGQKYTGQWFDLRVSSEFRELAPFIFVDILREYGRQSPGSRWSVLRRLFSEVNKEFLTDSSLVDVFVSNGNVKKLTRKEAFEHIVEEAYKYLRTSSFNTIEKKLAANALEHMGLDPESSDVHLHFESHDPTNAYKSLELYVEEKGISTPATEVGSGLQSAIVVAIFRTYEELKKEGAIFAVEEPEVFLHPQKARYFQHILQQLSISGNQVFITTHSPVFVDISEPETIMLVRRTQEVGSVVIQPHKSALASGDRQALRLLTEFDTQRSELFFARGVVLVEGNTEKYVIPLIYKTLDIDINRYGISVIECGGKSNLPLFIRVVRAVGIPYVVIADHDIKNIDDSWSELKKKRALERNKDHRRWNKSLRDVTEPENLFFLQPDLETLVGLPLRDDTKLDRALHFFSSVKADDIPSELKSPLQKLLSYLMPSASYISNDASEA